MKKTDMNVYLMLNITFPLPLLQQWARRNSCQPAPDVRCVCGDPPAGGHPVTQRARERRPADLGVHTSASGLGVVRGRPEAQLRRRPGDVAAPFRTRPLTLLCGGRCEKHLSGGLNIKYQRPIVETMLHPVDARGRLRMSVLRMLGSAVVSGCSCALVRVMNRDGLWIFHWACCYISGGSVCVGTAEAYMEMFPPCLCEQLVFVSAHQGWTIIPITIILLHMMWHSHCFYGSLAFWILFFIYILLINK